MAQLVVAAAGAIVGFVVGGPVGAQVGWVLGSLVGTQFAPDQKSEGPRLDDLKVSSSQYGTPIPYVNGHPRVAGQIIWASDKREIVTVTKSGKTKITTYTYEVDLLVMLTDNPIAAVTRIWSDGKLVYSVLAGADAATITASENSELWSRVTVYTGSSSQLPDPDYEAAVGTANAPAYRGRGSVFIKSLQLGGSERIPNLTFEVGTLVSSGVIYSNVILQTHWPAAITMDEACQANHGDSIASTYYTGGGSASWNLQGSVGAVQYDSIGWNNLTEFSGGDMTLEAYMTVGAPEGGIPGASNYGLVFYINANSNINSNDWAIYLQGNYADHKLYINIHYVGQVIVEGVFPGPIKLAIVQPASPGVGNPTRIYINDVLVWSPEMRAIFTTSLCVAFGGQISNPVADTTYGFTAHSLRIRRGLFSSDLAYGLDPSARYPAAVCASLVTHSDITVQSVVEAMCLRAGLSAGQFDATALASITKPVRAMAISQVSSARTVLDMLAVSYFFDAVLSDKIYFKPRGSAPTATLTFNELGVAVDSNADPLPLMMANELELPAQMAVTYSNVNDDYQTDTQFSDRLLTGQENTSATGLPLGFVASEAKQIADALLLDRAVGALSTTIGLGIARAALEPTDVLLITDDDASTYRMRVVKRTEASGVITLGCVADDASVFTQDGVTDATNTGQTTVALPVNATLALLDVPLLKDEDNSAGIYCAVAGSTASWPGCAIYTSPDDVTYTPSTSLSDQASIGATTSTLPAWTGANVWDEGSSVSVTVTGPALESVTRDGILTSTALNLAAIGNEVLQYRTATLVSPGNYTLSGFLRGRRGTESVEHASGSRFVTLGSAGVEYLLLQASELGRLLYCKAPRIGQQLGAVNAQSTTPSGASLKCFSPVNARANRDTADTVLTWTRRTRLSTRLVGPLPISAPLGEESERYEVDVYASGAYATLKRTLSASTQAVTYTSADQVTDFGAGQTVLYLRIYQISATVGRGHPLTAIV